MCALPVTWTAVLPSYPLDIVIVPPVPVVIATVIATEVTVIGGCVVVDCGRSKGFDRTNFCWGGRGVGGHPRGRKSFGLVPALAEDKLAATPEQDLRGMPRDLSCYYGRPLTRQFDMAA
jgi:hypothetical protein